MFNLKNKWTMRFGESREKRCKWFSGLGVMRIWVYIEKGGKCNILAKNNVLNQTDNKNTRKKKHELIRFRPVLNRFKLPKTKIDTIHKSCESYHWAKDQSQREFMIRVKIVCIESSVIWFNNKWIDSKLEIKRQRDHVKRFKVVWIVSNK